MQVARARCLGVAALLVCCSDLGTSQQPNSPGSSVVSANLDPTCPACQDFYQFANGGWLARHPVPADYVIWGSLEQMQVRNAAILRDILGAPARKVTPADSDMQKLRLFYASCMDSTQTDAASLRVVGPELERIHRMTRVTDLAATIARLHRLQVNVLFNLDVGPDFKRSTEIIATLAQDGLGLPTRDAYLDEGKAAEELRASYLAHLARIFELVGIGRGAAQQAAPVVLRLETALARAAMTPVQQRDPSAIYHKMSLDELRALAPAFAWSEYFARLGLADPGELNINQPEFMREVDRLVRTVPLDEWKYYLRGRLIDAVAPWLGPPFVAENLRFRGQLTGVTKRLPRRDRCLRATERAMGQALGRAFVSRTLSPATRERVSAMVINLRAVLHDRLTSLEWMSDTTRAQALSKLEALKIQIGHPDRWQDYSALRVESGAFVGNVLRANEFATGHELAKIGRPTDRGDWWSVTPQMADAFYSALANEIVVPAGILHSPFYDAKADDAINYGAIGAFLGHELTHAFDDRGRQFDAQGNLRDWWTAADAGRFTERARGLVEQFDGYIGLDSLHVNGALTLGENIADLGGLRIAFEGLQRALQGKFRASMDEFTPEQRFFLGWARIWRANIRPEEARLRLRLDPHAPWRTRVNGPLSNMPEFAEAFGCKLGDPMARPDSLRAVIW